MGIDGLAHGLGDLDTLLEGKILAPAPTAARSYRQAKKVKAEIYGKLGIIKRTRSRLHLIPVRKNQKINLRSTVSSTGPELEGPASIWRNRWVPAFDSRLPISSDRRQIAADGWRSPSRE